MRSKITTIYFILASMFQFNKANAQANKTLSNLISPVAVNQHLLPGTDTSKDIGSRDKGWRNLYFTGKLFLGDSLTLHANPVNANFFGGTNAGSIITSGQYNTGIGYNALKDLTTGYGNTALGADAMPYNYGSYNTTSGASSLNRNTTGSFNVSSGYYSLYNNTDGTFNTGIGSFALYSNTTGDDNTAMAYCALYSNTTGKYNTAYGNSSLTFNTIGNSNTAVGNASLFYNSTGSYNTAAGEFALLYNTTGSENTADGVESLYNNSSGKGNTAVGNGALKKNVIGNHNTAIGFLADVNKGGYFNSTAIGYNSVITASNQVRIGNSAITSIGGYTSWSNISDGRIKKNIKENVPGLLFINKLHPVTYNLNLDAAEKIMRTEQNIENDKTAQNSKNERTAKEQIVYTGFVAQDVEKAAKELNYEFSGVDVAKTDKDLYALRYAEFVVPLVKAVQELSKENEELKYRLDKLETKSMTTSNGETFKNIVIPGASLEQNTPNPSANETSINYTLPQKLVTAQIVLSDKNGKTLKEINISGIGKGTIKLDTSMLLPGTYNYSLIIDGRITGTKQMVVIK